MHELGIARSLVSAAAAALPAGAGAVREVHVRLGVLSGVSPDSLQLSFGLAAEGTPLQGSALVVRETPVSVRCTSCTRVVELASSSSLRCPRCGSMAVDVRGGDELEVEFLVLDEGPRSTSPGDRGATAAGS